MSEVTTVKLSKLQPSSSNVREYESTEVDGLAQSIKTVGVLQSLLVKPVGKKYEVIAGGRRLAAMHAINYNGDIPIKIVDEGANLAEVSLAENIYRQPLKDLEVWRAVLAMNDGKTPTVKEAKALAKRLHLSQAEVRAAAALASTHPELITAYANGELTKEVLKAVAHLEPDDQLGLVTDVMTDDDIPSYNRLSEIKSRAGHLSYREADILEKVGLQAYQKAGGKYSADLFSDSKIVHDKPLLAKLYDELLAKEDKELAKTVDGAVPLDSVPDDWRQTYLNESFADEADEQRWDEITDTLWEDDEELTVEQEEALRDERKSIEGRKTFKPDPNRQYGVHHGRWYYRELKLDEQEEEEQIDEKVTETVTPLSIRATDHWKVRRTKHASETVMASPDSSRLEALRCVFLVGRCLGPESYRDPMVYVRSDRQFTPYDWMTGDIDDAWSMFTGQQETELAKQAAHVWSLLFTDTMGDTFLTKSAAICGEVWTDYEEEDFAVFHKADQLNALAEELGYSNMTEFKGMKLKDKRNNLLHLANSKKQHISQMRFE